MASKRAKPTNFLPLDGVALRQRIKNKVKFPEDLTTGECWEWQGATYNTGHGKIMMRPIGVVPVHRVVFVIFHKKELAAGQVVRHKCNNETCVHPGHLLEGTHTDNMKDYHDNAKYENCHRDEKGRFANG